MKIIVFGAGGKMGRLLTEEALRRGHRVTAFVRSEASLPIQHPQLQMVVGDATVPGIVTKPARNHDLAVSAIGPNHASAESVDIMQATARALVEGLAEAGVTRLGVVGGAGSLTIAPGMRLVDSPSFPEAYRPLALAHAEAFEVFKTFPGDWTYFSPAAEFFPGEPKGAYRLGGDALLCDGEGHSRLSYADGARALLDVLEAGTHRRQRFTAAY